jgi:hypothetical protein
VIANCCIDGTVSIRQSQSILTGLSVEAGNQDAIDASLLRAQNHRLAVGIESTHIQMAMSVGECQGSLAKSCASVGATSAL